jgi:hypothetical protein
MWPKSQPSAWRNSRVVRLSATLARQPKLQPTQAAASTWRNWWRRACADQYVHGRGGTAAQALRRYGEARRERIWRRESLPNGGTFSEPPAAMDLQSREDCQNESELFTVVFYGLKLFRCKLAQFCATRCESYWSRLPSVRDGAQQNKNTRKNSLEL